MNEERRGFLRGAAQLLGGALALSVLPGQGVARAEKLIWTPDQEPVKPRYILQTITMAPGTTITGCTFLVAPDFSIDTIIGGVRIEDTYFDRRINLPQNRRGGV